MTDRDTFAAAALTGLLAGPAAGPAQTFDEFASEAFLLADAMLRERDKTSAEKTSGSGSVTLTDEERAAVRTAAGCMGMWMLENGVTEDESMQRSSATLRGLLERLG